MTKIPVPFKGSRSFEELSFFNILATRAGFIDENGAFNPPSLADSDANNNSVYYSTTQSKLVYKDSSGVVNNLY